METISYEDAKELGLTHFFTGQVQKCGHTDKQYVCNKSCITCTYISSFETNKKKISKMSETEYKSYINRRNGIQNARRAQMSPEEKKDLLRRQRISYKKWYNNLTVEEKYKEKIRGRLAVKKSRDKQQVEHRWLSEAFCDAKRRAKKKKLEFSIIREDLVVPEHCPIFNTPLVYNRKKGKTFQGWDSPTVDRIDNTKGYTKDNIAIISWRANSIKGNATLKELKSIVKWLEDQTI